ncbi:hypothetical protein [Kingella sp. (in: b-proteobacteria)]|uniref:hypothetical protein n=1 Tax=Kingella sp. (in: b-proteobacteria) TaxID=2020713 RepID=UPI0026DAEAF0|nr:hypothetical protein [Kingella sp. (in: b-proteobacteria)]MDO4657543.1 hypothetical protein [Kingella sp. (in: b-proteobacteria)]
MIAAHGYSRFQAAFNHQRQPENIATAINGNGLRHLIISIIAQPPFQAAYPPKAA